MKNIFRFLGCLITVMIITGSLQAQGPPISADKPIMLGAKTMVIKNTNEYRKTNKNWYMHNTIKYHYVVNKNLLLAVHLPLVSKGELSIDDDSKNIGFGDLALVVKPQFYRKDMKAKTLRMAAKIMQTFPTGLDFNEPDISFNGYKTHIAWLLGYETLKYGLLLETGYRYVNKKHTDEWVTKVGVGLPLLKPTYPVKQINLYFDYESVYGIEDESYKLFYGQGIQLAYHQFTIDFEVQVPLVQNFGNSTDNEKRKYSLLFGGRYIF